MGHRAYPRAYRGPSRGTGRPPSHGTRRFLPGRRPSRAGATLEFRDDDAGVAQIGFAGNCPLLLATNDADVRPYLAERHKVFAPGARVYRFGRDLNL